METYYLGGYYLIQTKALGHGTVEEPAVYTCSICINTSLLDAWAISWVNSSDKELSDVKQNLLIDDKTISSVWQWTDEAEKSKSIGWVNVFATAEAANEYRQKFFSHLPDVQIIGIYFREKEMEYLLKMLTPEIGMSPLGVYVNLRKRIFETQTEEEVFIGHDLIRIQCSGDFHSFHCYNRSEELAKEFGLVLNSYGLFDDSDRWPAVHEYMNGEKTDPEPWAVCKNKLVKF